DPDEPLAGGVSLDARAAHEAVGALAGELGLSTEDCAAGIVRVANAEMVRAMRVMTVEQGLDPRDFALLAFGGAGPLHAAAMAEELGMRRILVPRASGVLSALGLAAADRRRDRARTVFLHGDDLTAEARAVAAGSAAYDVRHRGQSFELTVRDADPDPAALREAFEAIHEERYGYRDPEGEIEVVTIRERHSEPGPDVRFEAPGAEDISGPTVVRLPEATLVVPEGWTGTTDHTGTIVLEREA
ncbi:MAG: N-methylhydantoinase, partial [Solirubrobacteraceae bacterium]|nr:N-methylhydantoinase [Solirubrobacteraceae bacterium]